VACVRCPSTPSDAPYGGAGRFARVTLPGRGSRDDDDAHCVLLRSCDGRGGSLRRGGSAAVAAGSVASAPKVCPFGATPPGRANGRGALWSGRASPYARASGEATAAKDRRAPTTLVAPDVADRCPGKASYHRAPREDVAAAVHTHLRSPIAHARPEAEDLAVVPGRRIQEHGRCWLMSAERPYLAPPTRCVARCTNRTGRCGKRSANRPGLGADRARGLSALQARGGARGDE